MFNGEKTVHCVSERTAAFAPSVGATYDFSARLFAGADLRLTGVFPVAYPYGVFEVAA
jgi:hypothetical protein